MPKGKIILILGCMFSEKTETLISHARRYIQAKKKIILIKYDKDTRYSVDDICSHNSNAIKATYACNELAPLLEHKDLTSADVILIDEGQFISDTDIVCDKLANSGMTVVISCLNGK
jgi:thymidine kinase